MILTGIEPMVCGNELERVTYTCERCGTRTVRFVKRPAGGQRKEVRKTARASTHTHEE
jgi:hypothetical protein